MRFRTTIAALALMLSVGCQELPNYFVGDNIVARVGRTELNLRDVESVVPAGVTGDDSVAFIDLYLDRWIKKQLKLQEAEQLFSSSERDIDRMVEEYRQSLLIRKVDQFYVDRSIDTLFTDEEISTYYKEHLGEFRLDRTLVRGRVLRFPKEYRQDGKLLDMMSSPSPERQKDFRDVCEKNNFHLVDFGNSWVDFQEFLTLLPTLRSQNYDAVIEKRSVQRMDDANSDYYYQISNVLQAGDPIPYDMVQSNVRRILFNQRQSELIRNHEQELYEKAAAEGDFRIYKESNMER